MKEFSVDPEVSGLNLWPPRGWDLIRFRRLSAWLFLLSICCLLLIYNVDARPARIALLTPEKTSQAQIFSRTLAASLPSELRVLDSSLSETAFSSFEYTNPFNLQLVEAQNAGRAIGCDYFILIRSETLRRDSPDDARRFESYAAIFTVSSRSGRLIFWSLVKGEDGRAAGAEEKLLNSVDDLALNISNRIEATSNLESSTETPAEFEDLPAEDSQAAVNFRPPLPYRRISPKYTEMADLYAIEATVDIRLDVDETGKIVAAEISRWAGYGLDESVSEAVLEMNWRPADRNGKSLPVRVLLRYNFKDIRNPGPQTSSLQAARQTKTTP